MVSIWKKNVFIETEKPTLENINERNEYPESFLILIYYFYA